MTTLLVPDLGRGHGTGHLRRCLKLLSHLPDASVLIPSQSSSTVRGRDELNQFLADVPDDRIVDEGSEQPTTVVLDLFEASEETVLQYSEAITIGLDIGGGGRECCSYVVDTLPRLDDRAGNVNDLAYLDLPEWRPVSEFASDRILVTFGGEDPAGLTEPTVVLLVERLGIAPERVTVVRPGLGVTADPPAGVRMIGPLPSLATVMDDNEWVICSYGLTAFEAAAAGRSVVTIAPTRYHDQLAARAGFAQAGVRRPNSRRLRAALLDKPGVRRATDGMRNVQPKSLPELILTLTTSHIGCPAHRGARGRAVWRGDARSYFRCPVCGTVYQERFRQDEESYGASYFAQEYRAQYGRSYLEDFDAIRQVGHRRLNHLHSLKAGLTSLLDIGCAYGPFLQAAAESGMHPHGIDISKDAIDYVTGTLGLPAVAGSVLDVDPDSIFGREAFDIVTLWYVIEHFTDLEKLLLRVSRWVRPGGVLAIATPSLRGVSGRRNPECFFSESPRDHHTIWSSRSAAKLLREYGFQVRRTVSTGHHPERYPAVRRGILPHGLAGIHSRVFRWGDTFELYAERTGNERSTDE